MYFYHVLQNISIFIFLFIYIYILNYSCTVKNFILLIFFIWKYFYALQNYRTNKQNYN